MFEEDINPPSPPENIIYTNIYINKSYFEKFYIKY